MCVNTKEVMCEESRVNVRVETRSTLTSVRNTSYVVYFIYVRTHVNYATVAIHLKGLFTWSGGPRSSGVGFFCFHALGDTKQKNPTPLDRGIPLHVNRV